MSLIRIELRNEEIHRIISSLPKNIRGRVVERAVAFYLSEAEEVKALLAVMEGGDDKPRKPVKKGAKPAANETAARKPTETAPAEAAKIPPLPERTREVSLEVPAINSASLLNLFMSD